MSPLRKTAAVLAATVITSLALSGTSASAKPADPAETCSDPVVEALHAVHEVVGDPTGLGHEAEETYCATKPASAA